MTYRAILGRLGRRLASFVRGGGVSAAAAPAPPVELSAEDCALLALVRRDGLSMVSDQRLYSTVMACKYVVENRIPGDFVECGVWRGGNALIAASVFRRHGENRKVYLYDTFAGMTEPQARDVHATSGESAFEEHREKQRDEYNDWCYASLEDVRSNFTRAGLLDENVRFIEGDVLDTLDIPSNIPERIALLRLDTDWYQSTRRELEVLYPRLSVGGVLIIDDYGCWAGARQATDEYFATAGGRPFFHYVDDTGRAGVKASG